MEMHWKLSNLCQEMLGNVSLGFWGLFEQRLKGFGDYLGKALRVVETLLAALKFWEMAK